jgi:threonine-phosphate decarboxylase
MGGHGGNIWQAARELGRPLTDILDFSASINPLGMPGGVAQAARQALAQATHYPEIDAGALRSALAEHHRLPVSNLLAGNGSSELLYLLPRALRPRRTLLVTPAFSEYRRALSLAGSAIDTFPLDPADGFRLDVPRLVAALRPETDLLLLANPGNPTGAAVSPGDLEALIEHLDGRLLLAVDEAFTDFAPELSLLQRVPHHANLCIFRSLTKFYGIAGLRAGFVAAPEAIIAALALTQEPWTLSTVAQAAARACLAEGDFRQRTLALLPPWRAALATGLEALGLTVYPGAANYLLARREDGGTAAELAMRLRQSGILIRDCADFPPLDSRYLRLAVRTDQENARLLQALEQLL